MLSHTCFIQSSVPVRDGLCVEYLIRCFTKEISQLTCLDKKNVSDRRPALHLAHIDIVHLLPERPGPFPVHV